jgi:uncharacterized small protein (DUF1192 family)/DNA-directed RNA polymerase subunit RPC12/RpoP
MGVFEQLKQAAIEIADRLEARVSQLDREIAGLEQERAKKQAERDLASRAPQRLANFPVQVGSDYLCPRCWIEEGKRSPIAPIPSETRDDIFRCPLCSYETIIQSQRF